jgi:hypothetical protein
MVTPPYQRKNFSHEGAFNLAVDMLIKCQRFFTEMAVKADTLETIAGELGESLFIIDVNLKKLKGEGQLTPHEYRLLSEFNEMLTDCAFSLQEDMLPNDVQYVIRRRDATKFPPSCWPNRMYRKTPLPFAEFPSPVERRST